MENKTLAWPEIPKNARVEKHLKCQTSIPIYNSRDGLTGCGKGPFHKAKKPFPAVVSA
jgi:hypothetical protein